MKIKRYDFSSLYSYLKAADEDETLHADETMTVVRDGQWLKADLVTNCKSWKTALRRFFNNLPEDKTHGWYDCLLESAENGYFKMDDSMMADGSRNPVPGYFWEIEELDCPGEPSWYIFLNVREELL